MKYDAFISYRHTEGDMYVAKRIHKLLETYRVPANVRKKIGKKKIHRVFRDQEELPIGSDLGDNIERALRESEYLVVICSPRTKESEWVLKEIETFISMHGRDKVLAVLVEGEPAESFPEQLLVDEDGNDVEPLAADVRGDNKRQINRKLKTESIRLVASILGCDYDDLRQRHRERRMRKFFAIAVGVAALAIAFGIYASYNLARINENYQAKLINESKTLAATSLDVLETGDRKTAALIALEGLPQNGERPLVAESIFALARALDSYDIGNAMTHDKVLEHELTVDTMYLSGDGSRLVTSDYTSNVYYWNVTTGEQLFFAVPKYYEGNPEKVTALYCDDESVYVASDKALTAYSLDGQQQYKVEFSQTVLGKAQFCVSGNYVLLNDSENAYFYDLKSGKVKLQIAAEEEENFGSDKRVSEDGKYAIIETGSSLNEHVNIAFIEVDTGEMKFAPLQHNSVLDACFTPDGYVAVCDMSMNELLGSDPSDMTVEKFDYKTGELIWQRDVQYVPNGINMSWTDLKSRVYTDDEGVEHSEIFVSGCTVVYGLDLADGTPFMEIHETSNIEHFGIKQTTSFGFILRIDGTMDVCDFTKGTIYSDNSIKISEGMTMDFALENGILAVRGYLSNELIIMSYMTGEGIQTVDSLDGYIDDVICAPDESTYLVVEEYGEKANYNYNYRIYSADTDELIDSFIMDEEKIYKDPVYLDNNRIAVFPSGNTFVVYDISKKKMKKYKPYDTAYGIDEVVVNGNNLLCIRGNDFYLYNLKNMKFKALDEIEPYVDVADVTPDGKTIFFKDYECKLYQLDVASGECKQIIDEYLIKDFSINPDGSQLAVACTDGKLRFYDVETAEIKESIDYYVTSASGILEYTEDGKYMLLHGADFYFKVLDLATHEIVFITDQQINTVSYTSYDPENGILAIKNISFMYLIDSNSWGVLQYASRAKAYLPQHQSILSVYSNNIYKFKYQTYEDLLQQVNNLYKDEKLSKNQKLKYNIQ